VLYHSGILPLRSQQLDAYGVCCGAMKVINSMKELRQDSTLGQTEVTTLCTNR